MSSTRSKRVVGSAVIAKRYGVSPRTARRWAEDGLLGAFRPAKRKNWRFETEPTPESRPQGTTRTGDD